jgi:hypothetical protein
MEGKTYNGAAYIVKHCKDGKRRFSFDSGRTWRTTIPAAFKACLTYGAKK